MLYIIVFGYPPDKYSLTAEYFQSLTGGGSASVSDPDPHAEIVNCFRIGYRDPADAMRAVRKNGEVLGGSWMVGAKWAVSGAFGLFSFSALFSFFALFFHFRFRSFFSLLFAVPLSPRHARREARPAEARRVEDMLLLREWGTPCGPSSLSTSTRPSLSSFPCPPSLSPSLFFLFCFSSVCGGVGAFPQPFSVSPHTSVSVPVSFFPETRLTRG
jgi:hypothetical protein